MKGVIGKLLEPWRTSRTWWSLVHVVLDLPLAIAVFVPAVVLVSMSLSLVIAFPLALALVYVLFAFTRLAGRVERHRLAALLGVAIDDPVPPLTGATWWNRFLERFTSSARWKELAYCFVKLPAGIFTFTTATVAWTWSAALVGLPLFVYAMPGDRAEFGLFTVSAGPATLVVAAVGVAGLVLVAPWCTLALGRSNVALARALLGPNHRAHLASRAAEAEAGRTAAIGTAEAERRRIERDLHDGAQQHLVALAMNLGAARERLETDPELGKRLVAKAHEESKAALREIRDLVRGIHPMILDDRGLDAALSAIVARSSVPVDLEVLIDERPPPMVESAAYFVVSEALTNVDRHAGASRARVAIARRGDRLVIEIGDDGHGGADPARGTGLAGLAERAASLGGTMDLLSPPGGPTTLLVELPCAS